MNTIRVFVGCAANHEDVESQAVLEWSIRKHCSLPVEITWMKMAHEGFWSGWNSIHWTTPFSGFRWGIPHYCNFEGRAIYMDSDIIVQADLAELWEQEFSPETCVLAKGGGSWRFCVSLWDCHGLRAHNYPSLEWLKTVANSHVEMCARFKQASFVGSFRDNWNCLDGEKLSLDTPPVKAIHYTAIGSQPQLRHALPRLAAAGQKHWFNGKIVPHPRTDLVKLFDDLLGEATKKGYGIERYMTTPPFGDYKKKSLENYKYTAKDVCSQ